MANQHTSPWSAKTRAAAKRILIKHATVKSALLELNQSLKFLITEDSIRTTFLKHEGGVSRYLKRIEEPRTVSQVLDDREEQRTSSRLRNEVDSLAKELKEARAREKFLEHLRGGRDEPRILPREKTSGLREMTAVVLASDWHVEERVALASVAGRNEYNLEIAARRIDRFFNAIIWNFEHHRSSKRIALRDLVLWLGGDFMTGYIHEELVENNQLSPTQTIRWLRPRLRNGILTLLKSLNLASITLPCSYGNHGRTTDKPRISTGPQNSYEWLMYCDLADEFVGDKRVRFEITESAHQYVGIYDWENHYHHGDDVRYQGGIGGLTIPLKRAIAASWDVLRRCDYHNIGHHHTAGDGGNFETNSSLIGYGPYSLRVKAAYEEPTQAMYLIDRKRGKTMRSLLWVGEKAAHEEEK